MNEEWREIPSFPRYLISSDGDVAEVLEDGSIKKIEPEKDEFGYDYVVLQSEDGRLIKKTIQRMVANEFVDNSDWYSCDDIWHKDGNLSNNTASNLEWVEPSNNPDDDVRAKEYRTKVRNERDGYLQPICCQNIETGEVMEFTSKAEIERQLGVRARDVLSGRRKRSGKYIFFYK